jgi:hypothetical protein
MALNIDDAVLKKTTKCHCGFSCLSGDKECLCDVLSIIGHEMLQIKSNHRGYCKYHILFGDGNFCLCPIRCELYNRHNI